MFSFEEKKVMYTILQLFDMNHTAAYEYLAQFQYPYQALAGIKDAITAIANNLKLDDYFVYDDDIWIHKTAKVAESASISGPCIIGENSLIRHCAFIRGNALIGRECIIGNSCELKNVILFDNVQVPHFNYVGDSILGFMAHMGAGSITSNVKADKKTVCIIDENGVISDTGLLKVGAFIGDRAEIGCNSVLNPGTVIGRDSTVYPLSSVRGTVKENHIYKDKDHIVPKKTL